MGVLTGNISFTSLYRLPGSVSSRGVCALVTAVVSDNDGRLEVINVINDVLAGKGIACCYRKSWVINDACLELEACCYIRGRAENGGEDDVACAGEE